MNFQWRNYMRVGNMIKSLSLMLGIVFVMMTSFGCDMPWDETTGTSNSGINGSWHGTATQTYSSDTTDTYSQGPYPVTIHFTFAQNNNTFTGTGYSQDNENSELDGFNVSDGVINGNSFSFTIIDGESEDYNGVVYSYTENGRVTGTINGNTASGTFEETITTTGPDGQEVYIFGGNFSVTRQ